MNLKIGLLILFVIGVLSMSMNTDLEVSKVAVERSISSSQKSTTVFNEKEKGITLYETFEDFQPLLQQNNDTTYVINFWATWCKPCVAELPIFEEFNFKKRNAKVKVVLCSLDFPNAIENSLYPFVQKWELQSKVVVLLDGKFNRWVDKVSPEWSGAIPATYIYKKDKKIFVEKSFDSVEELDDLIKEVI